jgi:ribose-phosphate pyrophosphokinase
MATAPVTFHAFVEGGATQDPAAPALRLAAALGLPITPVGLHRFPDGESLVTAPGAGRTAILFRSLDNPNAKLLETLLAAAALRRQGAQTLILVAPYLCYMRQDKEFAPGQAVSAEIMGAWLGQTFDGVVTVAPHLHRVARLDDVVTARTALALDPGPLMAGGFTHAPGEKLFVLGPDEESEPLARSFAATLGAPYAAARKIRRGDRDVDVTYAADALDDARVILIDDMISTGETLAACARQARAAGARRIDAVTAHVVGPADPTPVLKAAGIGALLSCDTLAHPSNRFETAPLIAAALKPLIG